MSAPSGRFSLPLPGEVEVQEHSKEHAWYDLVTLVKADHEVELNVLLNPNEVEDYEALCEIEIHQAHIADKETGRVFHVTIDARLQRSDAENLHAYLGFLLGLK